VQKEVGVNEEPLKEG